MDRTSPTARDALDAALDAGCPADEGRRLLDAYRNQVLAEAAELIAGKRNAVRAACGRQTADGMDRACKLVLAARTSRES